MSQKILIVEDDDYLRELYVQQLKGADFKVSEANDGKEALEKIMAEKPDLVILDIMLPVMNGLDVLQKVKGDEKLRDTKIILLTSLGQEGIIKEGFGLGADGYIIKTSITPDQIITEVKNFLAS